MTVYIDENGNGRFDAGSEVSMITGATGFYSFGRSDLPSQLNTPFSVGVVVPPGFQIDPSNTATRTISYDGSPLVEPFQLDEFTAIQGTVSTDFATVSQGVSGWTVFLDADNDGVLDADEASAVSDSDGHYAFHNVPVNTTQIVRLALQEDYYQTSPVSPETRTVNVGPGMFTIYAENDFGVLPFSMISGNIAGYEMNNGTLDPNTTPLGSQTVVLTQQTAGRSN